MRKRILKLADWLFKKSLVDGWSPRWCMALYALFDEGWDE